MIDADSGCWMPGRGGLILTGLEGDFCNCISGCWRCGTGLRAENSWERTGGVCSTVLIDRRVGESLGALRPPLSAAMPNDYCGRTLRWVL